MGGSEMERVRAVERYRRGEAPSEICASLGRSARWLYKWIERAEAGAENWWTEKPRRPQRVANRSEPAVEQLVVEIRDRLERDRQFSGAHSIAWELEETLRETPSIATINRILKRNGRVSTASRRRPAKGKRYPAPLVERAGSVHQSDFVGPRYLRGPVRFYSFNTVDLATGRCATVPIANRGTEVVVPALWESWSRLGLPSIQQFDNELVFFGSRLHPRGLSQILRLCLLQGVEPLFIPPAEPWRNGVIEKFNDHWQEKFLSVHMTDFEQVVNGSRLFDSRHNSRWRYRKHSGRTPNQVLANSGVQLRFPPTLEPPRKSLPRPEVGRYHFIRFIRNNGLLVLFGESFRMPIEAQHEYVHATVDVQKACLEVRLEGRLIESFRYDNPRH